ncbi:hypothetical protein [Nocardia wallacei]|uniref:hypothetical protein n=1 Tax=Nocardia wallacei TaxID=480035 RepID=UPI00245611A5|nr:hypothetical protein [Nocardia wallacei]
MSQDAPIHRPYGMDFSTAASDFATRPDRVDGIHYPATREQAESNTPPPHKRFTGSPVNVHHRMPDHGVNGA